jgi:hypothetical protein
VSVTPDGHALPGSDDGAMTTSHRTSQLGDAPFFVLLTLAHAAVAFPTLGLWAAWCERHKR